MKLLLLLFSVPALACPTVDGKFLCKYDGVEETILFKTKTADLGMTDYDFSWRESDPSANGDLEIPADKQPHVIPNYPIIRDGTVTIWCDDDKTAKGQFNGKYFFNNIYQGQQAYLEYFSIVGQDLHRILEGGLTDIQGNFHSQSMDIICKRY